MTLSADAIVVLGCKILVSGRPGGPAARRVATAARAYHDGVAPYVIASGGRRWGAHVEAHAFSSELRRAGVANDAILRDFWSLSTYENAIFSAALLRQLAAGRVAVVTCPWHMARAIENFRSVGVDACPLPAPDVGGSPIARTLRDGHELASRCLDVWAMRSRRVLRESAAALPRIVPRIGT